MEVDERLKQKKQAVDNELERILPSGDTLLLKAMRYAVLSGGKRFRPLLTLSSGECFGAAQEIVLPFACALELIHNYSLVHDDLPSLDNDDTRRGQPSCHKAFGEDIALLAGDSLLTLAFEVIANTPVDVDLLPRKERVLREISHLSGMNGLIGGQLMDITLSEEELTEDILHDLIFKKTGALITAAVKTGAVIGGADDSQLEAISQFGRNIGLAFQIRDDIHDFALDEERAGPFRPNYVSLLGLETAKNRLNNHIDTARSILDEASLESEELRHLASQLIEIENRKGQ